MFNTPLEKYRRNLRIFILPYKDFLTDLRNYKYNNVLDIGAGTGLILELLYSENVVKKGVGVEVHDVYFRKLNENMSVISDKELNSYNKKFDLVTIIDVLHHVKEKESFLKSYLENYLEKDGIVFIKDMNPRNFIFKNFNRLHDLIFANESIQEISTESLKSLMDKLGFQVVLYKEKRIFLYDHYWFIFRRK